MINKGDSQVIAMNKFIRLISRTIAVIFTVMQFNIKHWAV